MKQKLTISVDAELLRVARRHARLHVASLSSLVEESLREMVGVDAPSFTSRWRGKLQVAGREDEPRYEGLAKKYLR